MNWLSRWLLRRHYGRYVDPALVEFVVNNPTGKLERVHCKFSFVLVELSTSDAADHSEALRDCNARIDSVLGNLLLAYFVDKDIEQAQSAAMTLAKLSLRVVWGNAEGWIGDKGGDGFSSFGPMFDVTRAVALLRDLVPGTCGELKIQTK